MGDIQRPVFQTVSETLKSISLPANTDVSVPIDGLVGIKIKPTFGGGGQFTYKQDVISTTGLNQLPVLYNNVSVELKTGTVSEMLAPKKSLVVRCTTPAKLEYWAYTLKGSVAGEFDPMNQPITMTAFLAMAATGGLVSMRDYNVSGIPYKAIDANNFICLKGDGISFPSDELLMIDASTGARSHCIQPVNELTVTITNQTDGTAPIISFQTVDTSTNALGFIARVGDELRLACLNTPEIECSMRVTSTTFTAGVGRTFTGRVMRGLSMPNCTNGVLATGGLVTPNGGIHVTHQSLFSSAAGWVGLTMKNLGGRVKITSLSTSGSNLEDWFKVPSRIAQIRSFGRVGGIIINLLNNSINAAGFSSDYILEILETAIQVARVQTPIIYVMMPASASNENGSNPKLAANTSMYSAAWLTITRARDIINKYPECREIQIGAASMQNYGQADTTDVVNGYCVFHHKYDDGIHNLWGEAEMWAQCVAFEVQKDFPFKPWQQGVQAFNIFKNSVADPGGKFINNVAENFYGAVPNSITPGIPNSCSASATGTSGMTATHAILPNPDGGSDWVTTINSNGNTAGATCTWTQLYTGTTASLTTQLNLAANKGVPIEVWWDCGLTEMAERSMQLYELVLELDTGDGFGYLPSTGFSTMGVFQAAGATHATDGSKGDMDYGIWGRVRMLPFVIDPSITVVGARVRQSCKVKQNADPGIFNMRMGADPVVLVRKY